MASHWSVHCLQVGVLRRGKYVKGKRIGKGDLVQEVCSVDTHSRPVVRETGHPEYSGAACVARSSVVC